MNTQELLKSRQENFMKACNRNNPDYVPVLAFPSSGVIEFGNTTFPQVRDDPDAYREAMLKIWDHVYADVTTGQGIWFYPHAKEVLGRAQNYIGPDGISLEHQQNTLMLDTDYEVFLKDPEYFVRNILVKRRYPELFTEDMETVKTKMKAIVSDTMNYIWGGVNTELDQLAAERYGIVPMMTMDLPMVQNPVDILFDYFRGFKGTMLDIRRHPAQVQAALDILWETRCFKYEDIGYGFPFMQQWTHMAPYMSTKQFEKFYWPYQKKFIENIHRSGNKLYMLCEGKWSHLWDFFRDVPKDSVIINVDDDDVIEVSKRIGDWQIVVGGAKLGQLKMASLETNIDYAKRVLDECAGNGGFIFGCDKCWVCPGDVNQNLIDVYQWVHENGKY